MAGKSNIEKAAKSGDWSKLEKTARKALRKSGTVLGHSQADPEAEQEIEAAEVESEEPSIEEVLDPGNDVEDDQDEREPERQDLGDDEGEESEDAPAEAPAKAKPIPVPFDVTRLVSRVSSTSQYYLAGREAAEEQVQLERFEHNWRRRIESSDYVGFHRPTSSELDYWEQEQERKLAEADRREALEARMRALPAKE